jgi:hypothetical protein
MALFTSQKKLDAEKEIREKLAANPILDLLMEGVAKNGLEWVTNADGYYDNCRREILLESDYAGLGRKNGYDEKTKKERVQYEGLSYTSVGWKPMSELQTSTGNYVSEKRVFEIWGNLITERMKKAYPRLEFSDPVTSTENGKLRLTISYCVPQREYKSWS